jgi:hypothetical protein
LTTQQTMNHGTSDGRHVVTFRQQLEIITEGSVQTLFPPKFPGPTALSQLNQ